MVPGGLRKVLRGRQPCLSLGRWRLDGGSTSCGHPHHPSAAGPNLSLPPGLCFTPSASPERVYRPPIPLLRGKHKTRLDWFFISTGMW